MTLAEFLIGIGTIVTGVAITDIVQRIASLIEHRREIRWDWLPLLLLLDAVLTLLVSWALAWQYIQSNPHEVTLGHFLLGLVNYALIYLMCAAMLPRDPQPGLDMRQFFERQVKPYWVIYSMILVYFIDRFVVVPWLVAGAPLGVARVGVLLLCLGASVALIFVRRRIWHALGGFAQLAVLLTNLPNTF